LIRSAAVRRCGDVECINRSRENLARKSGR
jgi:hypothetical protein